MSTSERFRSGSKPHYNRSFHTTLPEQNQAEIQPRQRPECSKPQRIAHVSASKLQPLSERRLGALARPNPKQSCHTTIPLPPKHCIQPPSRTAHNRAINRVNGSKPPIQGQPTVIFVKSGSGGGIFSQRSNNCFKTSFFSYPHQYPHSYPWISTFSTTSSSAGMSRLGAN